MNKTCATVSLFVRSIEIVDMNRQEYERETARDPTLPAFLQYYEATDRRREHWRARPYHIDHPTKPVLKARLCLSTVNYNHTWGKKGKTLCNGIMMPPGCAITQKEMKNKRFATLSTREKRLQRTLQKVDALRPVDKLVDSIDRIAKAMAAMAVYAT